MEHTQAMDLALNEKSLTRHQKTLIFKYGSLEAASRAGEHVGPGQPQPRFVDPATANIKVVKGTIGPDGKPLPEPVVREEKDEDEDDSPFSLWTATKPEPKVQLGKAGLRRAKKKGYVSQMIQRLLAETRTDDLPELMRGYVRDSSIRIYMSNWVLYLQWAKSANRAFDVETLRAWVRHMVSETNLARATITLRIAVVKTCVRYLSRHKRIDKAIAYDFAEMESLPSNALPTRKRRLSAVRLSTEDVRRMVRLPEASRTNPQACQERALLYTFATTGMRVSEIVAIKVADIQQRDGGYVVANIIGKGASDVREAPISKDAVDAINDWLYVRPFQSEYVFANNSWDTLDRSQSFLHKSSGMTTDNARHIVRKYRDLAGLTDVTPHDFRRYVGTQLAKRDIRMAQRVLGHKNINTTAAHYVIDDMPVGVTEDFA